MKEHDTVKVKETGEEGTIVHVYVGGKAFEVELKTDDKAVQRVKMFMKEQLEKR